MGHLEHAAIGVAIPETPVETAQTHHLLQAQAGPGEQSGEDLSQREHTGAGFDLHSGHLDDADLAPGSLARLEHPDRQSTGGQCEGGRKTADPGPDHQNLGVALSGHAVPPGQGLATPGSPAPPRRPARPHPPGG